MESRGTIRFFAKPLLSTHTVFGGSARNSQGRLWNPEAPACVLRKLICDHCQELEVNPINIVCSRAKLKSRINCSGSWIEVLCRLSGATQQVAVHNPTVLGSGSRAGSDDFLTYLMKRALDQNLIFRTEISPPPDVQAFWIQL